MIMNSKTSFDFAQGIFRWRGIVWMFRLHEGKEIFYYINEYQPLKRGSYCMNLATPQRFILFFFLEEPNYWFCHTLCYKYQQ